MTLAACGGTQGDQSTYDAMPRLALTPAVEICAGLDDLPCQFVNAMIVAAAQDGRVAVADMMGELREFDAEGRFLRNVGGRGGGPGEYRALVAAGYDDAGRIVVLDQAGMRVQRFDSAGAMDGSANAPMVPGLIGASVVRGQVALFALPGASAVGDTVAVQVLLVDPATGDTASLPTLPEPALGTGDGSMFDIPPLFTVMPQERWGVSTDGALLLADGGRLRIVRRDADGGAPRVLVELAVAPHPVTAAELEAEKASHLEAAARMNPTVSLTLREALDRAAASAPRSHPMVSRLVVLDDGTILTREGMPPGADSARWNVFGAEGKPIGYLLIPADARIEAGRLERMLVVIPDEDDVPRVVWYGVGRDDGPRNEG